MPEGLARYGLAANPYARRELNLLADDGHADFLVRVDGFRKLDEIDAALAASAGERGPSFFLITGESGAGRTSVANFILARWRRHRKIAADRFLVPNRKTDDFDWVGLYRRWMASLNVEINQKRFTLPPELKSDLREHMRDIDEAMLEPMCRDLLLRVADALAEHERPGGFALCLEDVRTYKMISSAFEMFEGVPSCCVFTTLDNEERRRDVIDWYRKRAGRGCRLVELSPLVGEDVCQVVEANWCRAAGGVPNPFDLEGVRRAFSDRARPIGRVLGLFEGVLETKLMIVKAGPAWPADDLRFTADELSGLVRILERQALERTGGT